MSLHLLSQHKGERVWLVDASIYVFRAWFVRGTVPYDRESQPINATRGFLRFLYQLLYEQKPTQLAFAFDVSLQTSMRKDIYPDYKANRTSAPTELRYQFQLCRDFLDALGIIQCASQHHEADDLLGTWSEQQAKPGRQIVILSGDKDLAQLVKGGDLWWDFGRRKPLNEGGIKSVFGVWPHQIADQLALAGDKADNIPGIPSVGMSTAAKLLKRFGSLDQVLENIDLVGNMQVHGAKRLQSQLEEHQATARLARRLTGIHCDVPDLPYNLSRKAKDPEKLRQLCELMVLSEEQYQQWLAV